MMAIMLQLSELVSEIREVLEARFEGATYWINAEITDVKKYDRKRWCFLKFIEKEGAVITTEMKGVFWGGSYFHIENFERLTGRSFSDGLQLGCLVRVRFHPRYGLTLEVLEIDISYAVGKLAMEREAVLQRLLRENQESIRLEDGQYITENNRLPLPLVMQRVALITAPASDGQRDFLHELEHNNYGYAFDVHQYLVQIQGDQSSKLIRQQLHSIHTTQPAFDVVAIVRGGGSQTDFKPFDDYDLAKTVATFPVPVITGIGHDRNISIVDLMARASKTPTKAAAAIIDHNFSFEQEILDLKRRFFSGATEMLGENQVRLTALQEAWKQSIAGSLKRRDYVLQNLKRLIMNLSPQRILKKGFAIVMYENTIITDPEKIATETNINTLLKTTLIHSHVTKKTPFEDEAGL